MTSLAHRFIALLMLMFAGSAMAIPYAEGVGEAARIVANKDYRVLANKGPTDDPARIEVREFFYYGCPHCFHLETPLEAWSRALPADVYVTKSPAAMNKGWEPLARAFYVAHALGILEKTDKALFNALHLQGKKIYTREAIRDFFSDYGVSAEEFDKAYESFSVVQMVKNSDALSRQYGLTGVPAFVINGKYVTSVSMTGTEERLFAVLHALIQMERAAATAAKP